MFKDSSESQGHEEGIEIDPARLCPGLFIRLNLSWMAHGFLFNQFRIANQDEVRELQALGLRSITYFPARSTERPLDIPATQPAGATAPANTQTPAADTRSIEAKAARAEQLARQRATIAQCENGYAAAAANVRQVMSNVFASADKAMATAHKLVDDTMSSIPDSGEIVIHLMNEKLASETAYFHPLNVMVLSILLARELKLPPEIMKATGEAALLHDLGLLRVPEKIVRTDQRNRHEEDLYRLHTTYGREMAATLPGLPAAVREVIELHHERMDGKGYPHGLSGQQIPLLARLVGITNRYDTLCNPPSPDKAMTPAEVLTQMFRSESEAWDKVMLQAFIRMMGVYPPGTLVQLSNGNVALVVAVNHADLLRPSILVYDPATPREKALVVNLTDDPAVRIDLVLNPRELEPAALAYLSPQRRMSYYPESKSKGSESKGSESCETFKRL